MGSRPRLSAVAAFAAQRDGGIRAFHGLTPTAKCCRRLRGSVGTPGPALGDYHYLNRRPSGVWQFLRQGLSVGLSAAAAFAAQHCAELSMGSRPRLSAVAAFAAQRDGGIRFHGLTPTAKCCRRLRGSVGTPGPALGDYHYLNRRPSGVWQFLRQGLSVGLSAVAAFAAQHCAELSMGSRPRLSAVAAFAAQRDGGIRFHGLTPTAKCCRRLRGSKGWGHPVPWAHAHG